MAAAIAGNSGARERSRAESSRAARSRRPRVLVKEARTRARRGPSAVHPPRARRGNTNYRRGWCLDARDASNIPGDDWHRESSPLWSRARLFVRPSVRQLARSLGYSPPRLRPEYRGRAAAILGLLASLSPSSRLSSLPLGFHVLSSGLPSGSFVRFSSSHFRFSSSLRAASEPATDRFAATGITGWTSAWTSSRMDLEERTPDSSFGLFEAAGEPRTPLPRPHD